MLLTAIVEFRSLEKWPSLLLSQREFCIVAGGRSKSTVPATAFYPSPLNSLPRELAVLMGLFVSFVKLDISGLLYSFLTSR